GCSSTSPRSGSDPPARAEWVRFRYTLANIREDAAAMGRVGGHSGRREMGSTPRRRAGAAVWALTLIGAGCLALSPVQHAGAAMAAPPAPPGQGGNAGPNPP